MMQGKGISALLQECKEPLPKKKNTCASMYNCRALKDIQLSRSHSWLGRCSPSNLKKR